MTDIFYLGHSLVNHDLPAMVRGLAPDGTTVSEHIVNGAPLDYIWNNPNSDEYGRYRANAFEALGSGDVDVFVMTERVPISETVEWHTPSLYASNFYNLAMDTNQQTQVYLYETWADIRSGTGVDVEHDYNDHIPWRDRLEQDLALWEGIVADVNAQRDPGDTEMLLIPAGQAMARMYDAIEAGTVPGITDISDLFGDSIHMNALGLYFVAQVHYATIFAADPAGLPTALVDQWDQPFDVPPAALAAVMQEIAWETVTEYYGLDIDATPGDDPGSDDMLDGAAGSGVLDGGDGKDTVTYAAAAAGVLVDLENSANNTGDAAGDSYVGIENLIGSGFGDTLLGNAGDNTIDGGAGADDLDGRSGDDLLRGGTGDDTYHIDSAGDRVEEAEGEGTDTVLASVSAALRDHSQHLENLVLTGSGDIDGTGNGLQNTITGNDGDNVLNGAWNNDVLFGGAGNDTFLDDQGADRMVGGTGDDTYHVDSAGDRITENAGEGTDAVFSSVSFVLRDHSQYLENLTLTGTDDVDGTGNGRDNTITGNAGDNVLNGAWGNDVLIGGAGADNLNGGSGAGDTVSYANSSARVIAYLDGTAGIGGDAAGDTLVNVENLIGTDLNDLLYGDDASNTLYGGDGLDLLQGGAGADTLDGGAYFDYASYQDAPGPLTIDLLNPSNSSAYFAEDTLIDIEFLVGARNFSNTFRGDNGDNRFVGGIVDDTLSGNGGADVLQGGFGEDIIYGGDGNDDLWGVFDDDMLYGGAGNDRIFGGTGNDTAQFSGQLSDYQIIAEGNGYRITGPDGSDYLDGIEFLAFGDGTYSIAEALNSAPEPGNTAPVAAGDVFTVTEDATLTAANVLGNDTDDDGDALTVSLVSDVAHGTLSLGSDGQFNYTPDANFAGTDGFTYMVSDGNGGTDTANVSITVTPVNDAPVATGETGYAVTAGSETAHPGGRSAAQRQRSGRRHALGHGRERCGARRQRGGVLRHLRRRRGDWLHDFGRQWRNRHRDHHHRGQ